MDAGTSTQGFGLPRPRATGVIAIVLAAAIIAWIVHDHHHGTPSATAAAETTPIGPVVLSEASLRRFVSAIGHPIYWAGPEPGAQYELTQTANGDVFFRYLPPGARAGDPRLLRTVGTYPLANADSATHSLASEQGAVARTLPGGGFAVYNASKPTNVYLTFPMAKDLQIEVYDPSPVDARRLAYGSIRPLH